MTEDSTRPVNQNTVRYLSLDWINAISAEIAASESMRDVAQHYSIGVTQLVTGGPEGDVTYHIVVADGTTEFGAGAAEPEDVRMEQNWETAVAVATGQMNAREAFINGHLLLYGDQQKLIDSQPVFGALARAFSDVSERTSFE